MTGQINKVLQYFIRRMVNLIYFRQTEVQDILLYSFVSMTSLLVYFGSLNLLLCSCLRYIIYNGVLMIILHSHIHPTIQ